MFGTCDGPGLGFLAGIGDPPDLGTALSWLEAAKEKAKGMGIDVDKHVEAAKEVVQEKAISIAKETVQQAGGMGKQALKMLMHEFHVWKFIDSDGHEHWFQSFYDKGGRFEVVEYIPDRGIFETIIDVGAAIINKDYKGLIRKKVVEDPNFGKPPGYVKPPPRKIPYPYNIYSGVGAGKKKHKHGAPAFAHGPVVPPHMQYDLNPIGGGVAFSPHATGLEADPNQTHNLLMQAIAAGQKAAQGGYVGGGYTIAQTDNYLPPPDVQQTQPPPSQTQPPPQLNPIQFSGLADLVGPHHGHGHHHGGHGGGGWGWGGGYPYAYVSPYVVVDDIDTWLAQPGVIEEEREKCLAGKHTWDAQKARCIG